MTSQPIMSPSAEDEVPVLATVVIARNEEEYVGRCLDAAVAASAAFPATTTVLVDSCSKDRTVTIAARYPVRIVQLNGTTPSSAALGRLVGQRLTRSRYVLFVDGDTEINREWLEHAIAAMDADPRIAGVGGKLREVYYRDGVVVGENPDCFQMGNETIAVDQLGGNAVYRRSALETAGSFNPYVYAYEEAELAERLRVHGFAVIRIPEVVGTHHTGVPGSLVELTRRFNNNLILGYGQVLRLGLTNGLFWTHAKRMNRYLLFDVLVVCGILGALADLALGTRFFAAWAMLCAALIVAFIAKSRSVSKPFHLILDWSFWMVPMIVGFMQTPKDARDFSVEQVISHVDDRAPSERPTRRPEVQPHPC
jgi:glycosyltransferase involved in cell wall biosynthesis